MKPRAVILDTDIGTNVDDCLALSLMLASPELDIRMIALVHGDVALRARIVRKLLALRGRTGIPVVAGAERPMRPDRPVYWEGHEGLGLLEQADTTSGPDAGPAAELIVRTVMADPGQVTLAAIGPLTNVAKALHLEPRLAVNLARLVIMGGVVGGVRGLHLPWTEHNFHSDPEAAQVVLSSGAPAWIVPLDVTTRVRIRSDDVVRIRSLGDPFHQAVADQVERYPRFAALGWTYLHDPLAVAAVIRPGLLRWADVYATVETVGKQTSGKLLVMAPEAGNPANARVALGVAAKRAERWILGRLCT